MKRITFTSAFRLALDCCGRSFGGKAGDGLSKGEHVDWPAFLRLVRFHRIEGIASNALPLLQAEPPDVVLGSLRDDGSGIGIRNLLSLAASRDLTERFEAAGVPLLFLKGLTLGALAYGNPAIKSGIDIDLLIDPRDLQQAASLLRDCGFRLVTPDESGGDQVLARWHRHWKESVWASESPPLQLDLHTRLADNSRLLPALDVHSPRQLVEVGNGVRLATFATEELFAYLSIHGASSAWFRLKWISDFAGLLHRCGCPDLERLYRRSQELGAGRAAGQALLLADELFGSLGDNECLRQELSRDGATVRLFRTALRLVSGEPAEPTERRWGTLPIHRSQFSLLPGLGYKLSELQGQLQRRLSRVR